jgi:hypothetical protein
VLWGLVRDTGSTSVAEKNKIYGSEKGRRRRTFVLLVKGVWKPIEKKVVQCATDCCILTTDVHLYYT